MDIRRAERRIQRHDKSLKLRDPGGDCPHVDVMRKDREGRYQKLGIAKKEWLGDGTALLATLRKNDMWAYKKANRDGANDFMTDMFNEKDDKDRKRKEKRKAAFMDQGREERDIIHRMNGKRVNNAGVPHGSG
jgi:hypothetical protein